eukprot:520531-Pyramimonas_sp.AAC.1
MDSVPICGLRARASRPQAAGLTAKCRRAPEPLDTPSSSLRLDAPRDGLGATSASASRNVDAE